MNVDILANHCHDPYSFWVGIVVHVTLLALVLGSFVVYRLVVKRRR